MSDTIDSTINYYCKFRTASVRAIVDALVGAIAENWVLHGVSEGAMPPRPTAIESWLANLVPEKMNRMPEELTEEEIELSSESLGFLFSPASTWEADLSAHKNKDGSLGINLSLSSLARFYEADYRMGHDAQEKWEINKYCLINIIDKLVNILPIREIRIAPEITG